MQSGTHRSKQTYNIERFNDDMNGPMVRVINTVNNMVHAIITEADFAAQYEEYTPPVVQETPPA